MGIFSKKKDDVLVLLMPDGSLPKFGGQEGFNKFIEEITITPEKYDGTKPLSKSDQDAYIDAMSILMAVNTDSDGHVEKIYSHGPIIIGDLPGYRAEMHGMGVVTENFLVVRFPYGLKNNFFIAPYEEVEWVKSLGSFAIDLCFRNAILFDKKGKTHLKSHPIFLASETGKDGHVNRRTLSVWHTNAHMLKRQFS